MFRGNWRYIAAIVGLLVLGGLGYGGNKLYQAAEQQQPDYSYQPASHPGVTVIVPAQAPAKSYQPTCKNPQSQEDADLCAQWAAVQQVAESNRIASFNLRLGIGALLFTILGTWLLVWTLWEQRATSRRELRAYLFPHGASVFVARDKKGKRLPQLVSRIEIKNSGQTPAYHVRHWGMLEIYPYAQEHLLQPATNAGGHENNVPPEGSFHQFRNSRKLTTTDIRLLKAGVLTIYLYGRIEYQDAFGYSRFTNYKLAWAGWPIPPDVMMSFASDGNDAN